jgi:hypothetical protein
LEIHFIIELVRFVSMRLEVVIGYTFQIDTELSDFKNILVCCSALYLGP